MTPLKGLARLGYCLALPITLCVALYWAHSAWSLIEAPFLTLDGVSSPPYMQALKLCTVIGITYLVILALSLSWAMLLDGLRGYTDDYAHIDF